MRHWGRGGSRAPRGGQAPEERAGKGARGETEGRVKKLGLKADLTYPLYGDEKCAWTVGDTSPVVRGGLPNSMEVLHRTSKGPLPAGPKLAISRA
jgi:hypothetical protein